MCGIAGLWNFQRCDIQGPEFDRFLDSLKHRGPDGRGVKHFDSDRLWLGHRRLAVLDVSPAGAQPMADPEGRYWVTYNGEIYNFLEIRGELVAKGHKFRGHSDTEVLLAAFREWGEDCQFRFNGMWAFAIWDRLNRTLFLSRDRFGIKPLQYLATQDFFAFASELKAFLHLEQCRFEIDEEVLASTVRNMIGLEGTDKTWLKGVSRLPGGHCMTVSSSGKINIRRWWDTLASLPSTPRKYGERVEVFRDLFFDACRIRMRSDVPLATSLSGGLDSSAVFGTLHRLGQDPTFSKDWQRAFIAGFKDSGIDERDYALKVVNHVKAQAVITEMEESAFCLAVEDIVYQFEEVNSVLLAGLLLNYRAMRDQGVVVSLDGHGADECLGGYHFIVQNEMYNAVARLRAGRFLDLRKTFVGFAGGSNPIEPMSLRAAARYALKYSEPAMIIRRRFLRWEGSPQAIGRAPMTELLGTAGFDEDPRYQALSNLGKSLYVYFHYTVLPSILRNFDRASMANAIETRMPFMDWRLVTYIFALPDDVKIGHGFAKRILRDAMRGVVPDDIRLRTNKIGFTSPMGRWVAGGLRSLVEDTLGSDGFKSSNLFDGRSIAERGLQLLRAGDFPGVAAVTWPAINAHVLANQFVRRRQEAMSLNS